MAQEFVDPTIPMSVRVPVNDPLQRVAMAQGLQTGRLQQQNLSLEAQQRQMELDSTRALNAALAQAYKPDPNTGAVSFDEDAFMKAASQGPGAAKAQSFALGVRKNTLALQSGEC